MNALQWFAGESTLIAPWEVFIRLSIAVLVVLVRLEDKINLPSRDDHDPPTS